MSKMSELSQVLDELISCGEKMIQTANAIKECFTEEAEIVAEPKKKAKPVKEEAKAPEVTEPTYSKEDVRALLSQKAKIDGCKYKTDVKNLVAKYSSDGTLTKVPEDKYSELMAELEVVGNA